MSGCILIVNPVPAMRALMRSKLEAAYFAVVTAKGLGDVLHMAEETAPDAVLLSSDLDISDALNICRKIKSAPALATLPVMITLAAGEESVAAAFEAGADDVLTAPCEASILRARMRNLVRGKLALDTLRLQDDTARALGFDATKTFGASSVCVKQKKVLLMPATLVDGANWARSLAEAGMKTEVDFDSLSLTGTSPDASAMEHGLAARNWHNISALIIGHDPQVGQNGLLTLARLRSRSATRDVPVLMALSDGALEDASSALEMGANDFIQLPGKSGELAGRVAAQLRRHRFSEKLQHTLQEGVRLSLVDPLTRLHNRRYAITALEALQARVADECEPAAVMMLDLDRFKRVNDEYGHQAGDAVLKEVADRLSTTLGPDDLLARLGGEEFCVARSAILPVAAVTLAEQIRKAVETRPIRLPSGHQVRVTISIGVAMAMPGGAASVQALLDQADRALYASKAAGRNCVRFHRVAA